MKRNKKGISLITLVITIIIMIILAGAIVLTLTQSGIFDKANEATGKYNLQQVQKIAELAWADAYKGPETTVSELQSAVDDALEDNELDDKYEAIADEKGVTVKEKGQGSTDIYDGQTLGSLITSAEMYGTKINYEANGITDWKVFYSQTVNGEKYVYLIASEKLAYSAYYDGNGNLTALGTKLANFGATISSATVGTKTVGQIYWNSVPAGIAVAETAKDKWLAKWPDYTQRRNGKYASYFLDENIWKDFANTEGYKDANGNSYVVGAIGTPTAEMFVASWNAKREAIGDTTKYDKKLELAPNGTTGYYVNDITNGEATSNKYYQSISTSDPLYIWSTASDSSVSLASPSGINTYRLLNALNGGRVYYSDYSVTNFGVRPVVCLKSNIPVSLVDGNLVIK